MFENFKTNMSNQWIENGTFWPLLTYNINEYIKYSLGNSWNNQNSFEHIAYAALVLENGILMDIKNSHKEIKLRQSHDL